MISPEKSPRITWEWFGGVLIVMTKEGELTIEAFNALISDVRSHEVSTVLAISEGSVQATSVQRSEMSKVFKGVRIISVFDGSALTRGVITALGWLGMKIRAYSWKDLDQAILEIDPSNESRVAIKTIIERLQTKISIKPIIQ